MNQLVLGMAVFCNRIRQKMYNKEFCTEDSVCRAACEHLDAKRENASWLLKWPDG